MWSCYNGQKKKKIKRKPNTPDMRFKDWYG